MIQTHFGTGIKKKKKNQFVIILSLAANVERTESKASDANENTISDNLSNKFTESSDNSSMKEKHENGSLSLSLTDTDNKSSLDAQSNRDIELTCVGRNPTPNGDASSGVGTPTDGKDSDRAASSEEELLTNGDRESRKESLKHEDGLTNCDGKSNHVDERQGSIDDEEDCLGAASSPVNSNKGESWKPF